MRCLVLGSSGFIGKHLTDELVRGDHLVDAFHRASHDLTIPQNARELIASRYDVVFHVAGFNGNARAKNQFDIFTQNALIDANVLKACVTAGVRRVIVMVASCAYPDPDAHSVQYPLAPGDFLKGWPHKSVEAHGLAKRNLFLMARMAHEEGLNVTCVCPATVYGPGEKFIEGKTKVMGSLIHKFLRAQREGAPEVVLWGSGKPRRQFCYISDCVRSITEIVDCHELGPINIGNSYDIDMESLAFLIAEEAGYAGKITWDQGPDGQMRKLTAVDRRFPCDTNLEVGIWSTATDFRRRM